MYLTYHMKEDVLVVHIHSEVLDLHVVREFKEEIGRLEQAASTNDWVIDLSEVTFLDCGGIVFFLALHDKLKRRGGGLALSSPDSSVRAVLELLSLQKELPLFDSLNEAVMSIERKHARV